MFASGMRFQIELQQDGWRVRDRFWDTTAEFGGIPLEHLTLEEAHVMLGMLEDVDRAEMGDPPESVALTDHRSGRRTSGGTGSPLVRTRHGIAAPPAWRSSRPS
jgi:hypothetical protein